MTHRRVMLALALAAYGVLPLVTGAQARDATDSARAKASATATSTATPATATAADSAPVAASGDDGTRPGASRAMAWSAIALGLLGTGLAAWALMGVRNLTRTARELSQRITQQAQLRAPQTSRVASPQQAIQPNRPASSLEPTDLRSRVEHLEMLVARLREDAARTAVEARAVEPGLPDESPQTPFETATRPAPAPKPDVQVLPGVLSQGDEVRLSNSSRPMVHVHWAPSASTAEVWVNPEYKFADLTADYLTSAFEVDTRGPGSYETVAPAVIAWSSGASAGRVQVRGRVRAVGA